jgi:cobalt-zinc-cadmium efflux system membrane fusion protein
MRWLVTREHGAWLAAAALAAAVGCGSRTASPIEPLQLTAEPDGEGPGLRLSEASRAFIEITTVPGEPVTARLAAPGRVAFRDAAVARVGAPLAGRIEAVDVELGEDVEAGAALFTIGSPDAAAMRAEVASARSRLEAAQLEVQRQTSLSEAGVGLASELVRAQAELAQAQTEVRRAKVASRLIGRGAGGRVVVRAPIAGTVLSRAATAGAVAEPGDAALVEIGDPHALWVLVDVFEDELPLVQPGARAEVSTSVSTEPLPARVVRVAGRVDDRSRRAPVALELDPVPTQLRAGMFVRARIETTVEGRASLPASAVLVKDGGRTVVWVATTEPGRFEPREVRVGHAVDGRVPILTGLHPGDRVVTDNALLLDAAADQLL